MNESNDSQVFIDLLLSSPTEHFETGEYLMKQGEQAGFAFLIHRGTVSIQREMPSKDASSKPRVLAKRSIGDLVGELSMFSNVRSASVLASTAVEAKRISHGLLLQLISNNPTLSLSLLATVMRKAQDI
jgi:CRP-like cAMP-binding protein